MNVLGIEISYDNTSTTVYSTEGGLLSTDISSQLEKTDFGGMVPEQSKLFANYSSGNT